MSSFAVNALVGGGVFYLGVVLLITLCEWFSRMPPADEPRVRPAGPHRYIDTTPIKSTDPEKRAAELLYRLLTPAQQIEWINQKSITVIGDKYDFKLIERECCRCSIRVLTKVGHHLGVVGFYLPSSSGVPHTDMLIAQLLHVRGNLGEIEQRACRSYNVPRRLSA